MRIRILFFALAVLFSIVSYTAPCTADTGTYEIEDYTVTLFPKENGYVEIKYYQKWKVTGGNIPWITVGTANRGYTLLNQKTGRNVSGLKKKDSGSWSGIYIALDRKYVSGETFEVEFSILQNGLFYKNGDNYRFHFIPGWYDRAVIKHLKVDLSFFSDLEGITPSPEPDRVDSRSLSWERYNLKKGGRFVLSIVFPRSLFPGEIHLNPNKKSARNKSGGLAVILTIGICFLVILIAAVSASGKNSYGSGGKIRTGGRTHVRGTGCVVSCACACVACACACACAGGGAAGCDRKLTFSCPLCRDCKKEDCPLRP